MRPESVEKAPAPGAGEVGVGPAGTGSPAGSPETGAPIGGMSPVVHIEAKERFDWRTANVISINLEPLYDALGGPDHGPAWLLRRILEFYKAKPIIIVNYVTDAPPEHKGYYIDYAETRETVEKFEKVYYEGEWKDWDEFLKLLAAEFNAVVIELYDGYDTAVAVVSPKGEGE
jgi:hypothetical protein